MGSLASFCGIKTPLSQFEERMYALFDGATENMYSTALWPRRKFAKCWYHVLLNQMVFGSFFNHLNGRCLLNSAFVKVQFSTKRIKKKNLNLTRRGSNLDQKLFKNVFPYTTFMQLHNVLTFLLELYFNCISKNSFLVHPADQGH